MDLALIPPVLRPAALAAALCAAGCSGAGEARERPPSPSSPPAPPAASRPGPPAAAAAAGAEVRVTLPVEARLVTETEVAIVARATGLLEEVLAERGDRVEEGQLLARFENRMQELQYRAAEAELARAAAEEERARKTWDQKLASRQDYDRALRDRDVAQAERDLALYLLELMSVRAPFAGVITERAARPGMYILEDDAVLLFRLVGDGPLEARVYLPEWAARYLDEGEPVAIVPIYGSGVLEGRVHWRSPIVEPVAGTVETRVRLPAASGVPMGTSVTLRFSLRSDPGSLTVPRACVREASASSGGEATLLVAAPDGSWRERTVRLGLVGEDRVEVLRGLEAGESVAAAPGG
jgi:RND family efflux transporter MFP subunit